MTKRLLFALLPIALVAACKDEASNDSRSASGEVLEGTVSDAMLPVDRVRSEPPLEDPEAFAKVQEKADKDAAETADGEATEDGDSETDERATETPAPEPTPEAAD